MTPDTLNWKRVLWSLALLLISGCTTSPEEQLRRAAADGNLLRVETFLDRASIQNQPMRAE